MIQLMRWGKRKHPARKCGFVTDIFKDVKNRKSRLRYGYLEKNREIRGIQYFAETSIIRHTKVVGDKSIYDNDLVYWFSRGKALGNRAFSKSMLRIFRQQNNKCNLCGLKFLPGDVIEIDHIAPKASGGKDYYSNLQAVHGHCHDQKS